MQEPVTQPVFRFAPSPNGRLHLGHALSALRNEAEAARLGGRLLLRIEDIDLTRCRPEFEAHIRDDLDWLGIAFAGEPRRQSEHLAEHGVLLDRLAARGLLYPCACSRTAIREASDASGAEPLRDPDGAILYPGTCRALSEAQRMECVASGEPHALRLDMAAAIEAAGRQLSYIRFWPDGREAEVRAQPARWGDVTLARKETPTSYHLAVVADDAAQGVTHVVRGEDLEAATDVHVLLQALLGLPTPRYQFHELVLDESHDKLSKSRGSTTLAQLRAEGLTAREARLRLGFPVPSGPDAEHGEPDHHGSDRQ